MCRVFHQKTVSVGCENWFVNGRAHQQKHGRIYINFTNYELNQQNMYYKPWVATVWIWVSARLTGKISTLCMVKTIFFLFSFFSSDHATWKTPWLVFLGGPQTQTPKKLSRVGTDHPQPVESTRQWWFRGLSYSIWLDLEGAVRSLKGIHAPYS